MPYASEAEYKAAVVAYRALHDVFYRFQKSVRDQHLSGLPRVLPPSAERLAADERDYASMAGELLPALVAFYAGPPIFVDRLADTLRQLGERHAAAPQTPFEAQLTRQAYIDVDNVLQDLLREREHYPRAFDDAFLGTEPPDANTLTRPTGPDERK
jgi:hypothetical protein